MRRPLLSWAILCAVWSLAWAEQRPILHEPLQVPQLRCSGGICRRDGAHDGLPEAIEAQDGLVRAPPPAPIGADEPIYRPGPPGGAVAPPGAPPPGVDPPPIRRALVGPDRSTGPEAPGERLYHEVFNPAVLPFKRMTALDAVAEDESLRQRAPQLVPLAAGAQPAPGRDPFYGTIVVDFPSGRPVPIPSPAAGVRLLSYRAEPPAALQFYRDGADNLYVSAASAGLRRITYLVDAEQRYFAGPLPAGLRTGHALLPPGVQRHADLVLRHIGVDRQGDYRQALEALVRYFRDFRLEELREHRGSTYLDIALERRGVCRHRVYAFVITAIGAGIAARYVENELHVFAEVYVPLPGGGYWRRVNLGGAPLQQMYLDTAGKEAYRDKGGDPFAQPEAYQAAQPPHAQGLPRQAVVQPEGHTGGQSGAEHPGRSVPGRSVRGASGPQQAVDADSAADDPVASLSDTRREPAAAPLAPTAVSLSMSAEASRSVYRGAVLRVHGQVQVRGGSPDGLEVYLLLDTGDGLLPLGHTAAGPDGAYSAEVEVPSSAPLGKHRLVARVRGDDSRRGSASSRAR